MDFLSGPSITAIADLLKPPEDEDSDGEDTKQAVTTEDIYLQMGNKTPTTASCEEMVVKIKLPDTKLADVELDVKNKFLDCRTPKYKLGLHLPHPVDHKSGKAEWDGKKDTLIVTLRIVREFDFMNF
ncbi:hypothetical protein ACJMK2_030978 [Sinanodonta woodiana]|uniref:PIH1D1/2/3 CS-like domain-containing protein n=1 Tax=Sinanodonta woodiana TaxID=1069815 RepID=A0ABD3X0U3_SINWO